mmetsp:Transcript_15551/g.40191  ORF Transcript_15551/g.40191 Transcript_15551/m.40191 type:complete len:347 (+) Transcript_15551:79-1119(+)
MTVRLRGAPRPVSTTASGRADAPSIERSSSPASPPADGASDSSKQIGSPEVMSASTSARLQQRQLSPSRRALLSEMATWRNGSTGRQSLSPNKYRPLSVVHQVPHSKGSPIVNGSSPSARSISSIGIRWADGARDKGLREQLVAERELEIIEEANASSPLKLPSYYGYTSSSSDAPNGDALFSVTKIDNRLLSKLPGGKTIDHVRMSEAEVPELPASGEEQAEQPNLPERVTRVAFANECQIEEAARPLAPSARTRTAVAELRAHLLSRGSTDVEITALFAALNQAGSSAISAVDLQEGLRRARANEPAFAPLRVIAAELFGEAVSITGQSLVLPSQGRLVGSPKQ